MEENLNQELVIMGQVLINEGMQLVQVANGFLQIINLLDHIEDERPDVYCIVNNDQKIVSQFLDGTLDFKKHIRVERRTFNVLEDRLTPRSHGWACAFRLLVFLFWLGCGTSYRVIAEVFNVPTSTVCDIVNGVRDELITKLLKDIIRFPNIVELADIGRKFARNARSLVFSNVAGAMDGCHVKVKVTGPGKQDYFNRKCDYSVQFQAIVDGQGKFIDIFAGYPGSVHDSRVLRASPIYRQAPVYPPPGFFLLGDGGYPLIERPICIVTPYRNPDPENHMQIVFNTCHSRARNVVERAFGMLKARWRCMFMKTLEIKHTKVARIITVCAIMHNICLTMGDVLQPVMEVEEEWQDEEHLEQQEINALQLRDHLARNLQIPVEMMD